MQEGPITRNVAVPSEKQWLQLGHLAERQTVSRPNVSNVESTWRRTGFNLRLCLKSSGSRTLAAFFIF